MIMHTQTIKNRVGIYTQESAEVTAAGDGLASQGDKSPVTITKNLDVKDDDITINKDEKFSENDNDKANENDPTEDHESKPEKEATLSEDQMLHDNSDDELQEFPQCEEHIGKENWNTALEFLEKEGFLNWEINTMFQALDYHIQNEKMRGKRKDIENVSDQGDGIKKTRLNSESEKISGILLRKPEVTDTGIKVLTKAERYMARRTLPPDVEKYCPFELRANIGDARHFKYFIPPKHRQEFRSKLHKFVDREGRFYNRDVPINIVNSCYINQTLMIECRNVQTLEFIDKNVHKLNHLWPEAYLLMLPRSSEKKNIEICIPYKNYDSAEILKIIEKQNRVRVEEWTVNECKETDDEICLSVEVDGGTYLRLFEDQEDLFFLMNRATIKLPKEVPTEVPAEVPIEVPTEVPTEVSTEVPTEVPSKNEAEE